MSNEELFGLRQLFRDVLDVRNIEYRVPPRDKVYADDFLITADKNPNSRSRPRRLYRGGALDTLCCARRERRGTVGAARRALHCSFEGKRGRRHPWAPESPGLPAVPPRFFGWLLAS